MQYILICVICVWLMSRHIGLCGNLIQKSKLLHFMLKISVTSGK